MPDRCNVGVLWNVCPPFWLPLFVLASVAVASNLAQHARARVGWSGHGSHHHEVNARTTTANLASVQHNTRRHCACLPTVFDARRNDNSPSSPAMPRPRPQQPPWAFIASPVSSVAARFCCCGSGSRRCCRASRLQCHDHRRHHQCQQQPQHRQAVHVGPRRWRRLV